LDLAALLRQILDRLGAPGGGVDVPAVLGEPFRRRPADSSGAARDQHRPRLLDPHSTLPFVEAG
jgi:hypothetical protein